MVLWPFLGSDRNDPKGRKIAFYVNGKHAAAEWIC